MALIDNRATSVGDVIYIKTDKPIIGLVALTDFQDLVVNESNPSEFDKEFRYSFDGGITWSNWITLNDTNIQSVPVTPTADFVAEYKYTRTYDSDNDGDPEIHNITLDGEFQSVSCGYGYVNSIFNQFFNCHDIEVLDWCINVTEKLYKEGIVPNYLIRDEEIGFNIDKDYIDYWRTISCFFAYFVIFSRQFANFSENETLLRKFLTERGLYYCNDTALADLQYLMKNYYDEIRKRGTRQIYKTYNGIQGELLRLICYNENDEFLFDLTENKDIGWNVGNSSPLYKGLYNHINLNKAYEDTKDVQDLSNYPIKNSSYVDTYNDNGKNIIRVNSVPNGEVAGIGDGSQNDKYIKVNPYLNYEITFWVKHNVLGDNFNFACFGYDVNGNQISFLNNQDGTDENNFILISAFSRTDKYYFVRGIIYNVNQDNKPNEELNIKTGNQLRFKNDSVAQIMPRVLIDNDLGSGSDEIYIYNFKVKPVSINFSKGFLQSHNFIINFVSYNNNTMNKEQFEEKVRKYLIPYNAIYKPQYLEDTEVQNTVLGSFDDSFDNSFD